VIESLRELAGDNELRSDVSVKLGLSGISAFVAIVVVDEVAGPLPAWSLAIPFGLWVACATVAPDREWQHEQVSES
jgi:hypothetical protein